MIQRLMIRLGLAQDIEEHPLVKRLRAEIEELRAQVKRGDDGIEMAQKAIDRLYEAVSATRGRAETAEHRLLNERRGR